MVTRAGIAPGFDRYGATREEWAHWSAMPFANDLLPVVCNPRAVMSPGSRVDNPFKTPTVYRDGKYSGFKGWTSKDSTGAERAAWAQEPDYGICVVGRTLHAIDIDVTDAVLCRRIMDAANVYMATIGKAALRMRHRAGNPRALLAFAAPTASMVKRWAWFAPGRLEPVEFLANRQHFVIAGQHKSGSRYEWAGGLPVDFPELDIDQANGLWDAVANLAVERSDGPGSRHAGNAFMGPRSAERPAGTLTHALIAERLATARVQLARRQSNGMSYEDWFAIGAALHHATEGSGEAFALWDEWSATDDRYPGTEEIENKWASMPRAEGDSMVGMGTLVRLTGGDAPIEGGRFPDLSPKFHGETLSQVDDFADLIGDDTVAGAQGMPEPSLPAQLATFGRQVGMARDPGTGQFIYEQKSVDSRPRRKGTLDNVVKALQDERFWPDGAVPPLCFNVHSYRIMFGDVPVQESDYAQLKHALEAFPGLCQMLEIADKTLHTAVLVRAMQTLIDPMLDWLNTRQWDGVPRITTSFIRFLGVPDNEYTRLAPEYVLTSIVARQIDPGHKVDMSLALIQEDKGGIGKTTFVQSLVPYPHLFKEFSFEENEYEIDRKLLGAVVVENSELRGLRRDVFKIKAFMSRRDDSIRVLYVGFVDVRRRHVTVMTGNESQFIAGDAAMARRFIPLNVTGMFDIAGFIAEREQIYAEAVHIFKERGIPYERMARLALPYQAAARTGTVLEMTTLDVAVIQFVRLNPMRDGFTLGEIIEAVGEVATRRLKSEDALHKAVTNTLKVLGFEHRRDTVDAVRSWRWYRKPDYFDDLL